MLRRIAIGPIVALLALLLVPVLAGPAVGTSVRVADDDGASERVSGALDLDDEPVAGVRITASVPDGEQVGEAVTGPEGEWAIDLPGPGRYEVALDTETLPEDVSLRVPDRDSLPVPVVSGQDKPVIFPLGAGDRETVSKLDRSPQLVAEGLRFGLVLALASVGLSLIYGTTKLINFAHGELVTYGALIAFWFNVTLGLPLIIAGLLAVLVAGATGWAQDRWFWGVLRRRGSGVVALMIISIGLGLAVRFLFLYFFGGQNRAYEGYRGQVAIGLGPLPVALPPRDYWSMGIAVVVLAAVLILLARTRLGKATRAVADNPALAETSGIDADRVIRSVWTAGTALAGLAGILLGIAQQVQFEMGNRILLLMFAAVILGGLGTATGALFGSLIVGVFIQLSTLVVSPELKNVGALGVLILILLVRPQGLLGRAERVG